jgi:hypothetical protein
MVGVLAALSVSAQEIGTEIQPAATPSSGVRPASPNDNPYAPQTTPPTTSPVSASPPANASTGAQHRGGAAPAAAIPDGAKLSAGAGAFGIRAGFGGGEVSIPTGAGTTLTAPTVGLSIFASDDFTLLIDAGFGLAVTANGSTPVAFGLGLGFDYHFRTVLQALRPLFTLGASFNMLLVNGNSTAGVSVNVGGGAEYFLSPSFSLIGKITAAVPMSFPNGNFTLGLFTFTPGVGAAWYF